MQVGVYVLSFCSWKYFGKLLVKYMYISDDSCSYEGRDNIIIKEWEISGDSPKPNVKNTRTFHCLGWEIL